ncbi:unnamed protein product [Trichobilharzia regenti]|nr:unnamed protein product [Trichobilharzia regenti]
MNLKAGKHDSDHSTAASRVAEATNQVSVKRNFSPRFGTSNQNEKCSKQANEGGSLSDDGSHRNQYRDSVASTPASKSNRVIVGVTRKSKPSQF